MSKKGEFKGMIQVTEEGKILWFNVDKLREFLINGKGKRFEFVVKNYRSMQQLKYYWTLVKIVADHLGYDEKEMHEIIKCEFLTIEYTNENTGTIMKRVKSTKELSVPEMNEYIDKFKRWAAIEFSVNLPDPEQQQKIELNE